MSFLFANRVSAQLARTITTGDTTLTLMSGTGTMFPTISRVDDAFAVTLVSASNQNQYEIVYCVARNGDALTVLRGQEDSNPLPFQSGDIVSLNMTAALYRRLPQAGYLGQFSQEVAQAPGGYQKGAIVCDDTPGTYWISLINQNTTAPNANNQTWRKLDTNGLLHPPDISGLVSGAAFNGAPYQNDFSVSNVGVNKANGTPWFYSPNGGGVINLALQSALQQETQRAQATEAGLLPLAGGTITGPINRAGGGVLPEVIGLNLTGRVVIQAFVATGQTGVGNGNEAWVSFPASFTPGTVPVISIAITRETGGDYVSRFAPIGVYLNTSTPHINNTGFNFQPAYVKGGEVNTSGGQWTVQVIAIGVMQ